MGFFDNQIRTRKLNDSQDFDKSFRNIAMAVTGDKSLAYELEDKEIAQGAIDRILQYYRVPKKEKPIKASSFEEMLSDSIQSAGIMYRKVELKKGWRRDAYGAMIGFLRGDNTPVALLPLGAMHYRYYDENKRKYIVVHSGNEGIFLQEAFVFYRPFPLKKLGIIDLLKYIFSVMERFDKILVALVTLLITLIGMLTPKLNLFLFNNVAISNDYSLLIVTGVFLLSVSIGSLMFNAVKSLLSARIDTKMSISVEAATMMRILSLPAGFFKDYSSGELSSRAGNVNSLCTTIVSVVFNTGLTSLFSLLYITQIFTYAPGLVVPALIIILITVGFSVVSSLMQMKVMKEQLLVDSKENGMSYALVSGIEKIKLTGAEKRVFAKWGNLYAKSAKLRYNPPLLIKINAAISTAITLIGTIVMYNQAIVTNVSSAEYYAFNTAYGMVSGAFMSLFSIALTAANLRPTLKMAEPILKAVPEISDNKEIVNKISGSVELMNLSFQYKENSPIVLDNISLKINPGQYVAVVGKTGCGKSTLVRLLLGFEQPTKGGVFYDGKDINSLDLRSLRKNIGVVTQNGKLIQGDIYSNITVSAPHLTVDEAWEAAKIAGIDEDIRLMPMGMNTVISEGGGGISGGQKQRLMIARAVAPKPKLLIFDEATSALDNITQKKVSDSLDQMKCTRIVIAHRLSTIKQCDRILVIDGGHIVEDGTYDELVKLDGFFADLVSRQRVDV